MLEISIRCEFGQNNTKDFSLPCQETTFIELFETGSVRLSPQGLLVFSSTFPRHFDFTCYPLTASVSPRIAFFELSEMDMHKLSVYITCISFLILFYSIQHYNTKQYNTLLTILLTYTGNNALNHLRLIT